MFHEWQKTHQVVHFLGSVDETGCFHDAKALAFHPQFPAAVSDVSSLHPLSTSLPKVIPSLGDDALPLAGGSNQSHAASSNSDTQHILPGLHAT